MKKITLSGLVLFMAMVSLVIAPSSAQEPAQPRVTNVIVFDVAGNLAKFNELSKRARAISEKYASTGKARMWLSAYAGPNTNHVVVTVEYPSLVSMAQSVSKVNSSPEWAQLIADAGASNIRPISNSVVVELPQ